MTEVNNEIENTKTEDKVTTNPAPITEETPEQINWKKFREARDKERKEKQEIEKRAAEKEAEAAALKAALEAIVNKPSPKNQDYNEPNEESEEQRIERLVDARLEKERRRYQEEAQIQEARNLPHKLAQTMQDFDKICSTDNLDYLEYHYPEVAGAFKELPDTYEKWAKVYQAVKRFVPNTDHKKDQAKADKNLAKPQSMNVAGKTAVGDSAPMMLDEKRKAANWERMVRTMRSGGK